MDVVKIKTKQVLDIEATFRGRPVDDVLHEVAGIAHELLEHCSLVRQELSLPDTVFDPIEGSCCRLLDLLGD